MSYVIQKCQYSVYGNKGIHFHFTTDYIGLLVSRILGSHLTLVREAIYAGDQFIQPHVNYKL